DSRKWPPGRARFDAGLSYDYAFLSERRRSGRAEAPKSFGATRASTARRVAGRTASAVAAGRHCGADAGHVALAAAGAGVENGPHYADCDGGNHDVDVLHRVQKPGAGG